MNIKEELKRYQEFKKNYKFESKDIKEINGIMYYDNQPLINEKGEELGESDTWINVGYKLKGMYAKVLSNLFPYEFEFRGKKLNSIECIFQGIKFKNIDMQNLIFKYSGLDACRIKIASDIEWKKDGLLYWQGQPIVRDSKEYEDFIDEVYISAIQNPLYRNVLKKCNKDIIHIMGEKEKSETVFTRYEFERQLNSLKDFLKT